MSAWPTGQAYTEVVQNPRTAFQDPVLQGGRIETDRLGLPRPRSGNFAVVYKIDCGSRSWAVKCFTREASDQQRRYASISAHLRRAALSYTVEFDYLPQGIRVAGTLFPLLKMEWVSGDPLIRYIEKHLQNSASILAVASRWVEMVKALKAAGIAHGDLQHGNIIVLSGGQLKLVDYDGMFVPDLKGAPATEQGHPNYQHPDRANMRFGGDLDNFSSWTVYVSLIALSIDPSLWSVTKAGDDCLLFRAQDFAAPDTAQIFQLLGTSPDQRLRSLIGIYRELLRLPAEQVPALDGAKLHLSEAKPQQAPSWLDDHLRPASPANARVGSPVQAQSEASYFDASWVLDFVTPQTPPADAKFVGSLLLLQLLLVSSVLTLIATIIYPGLWPFPVLLAACHFVLLMKGYRDEPGVGSLRLARAALKEAEGRLGRAAAELSNIESKRNEKDAHRIRNIADVHARVQAADRLLKYEMDLVNNRLTGQLAGTQATRKKLESDEYAARGIVAKGIGVRVMELKSRLGGLAQDEARELGTTLKSRQESHIQSALLAAELSRAQISGLGPQLKSSLISSGFTSALDVFRRRIVVRNIGPSRVAAITNWAKKKEAQARGTMPKTLMASEVQTIKSKYGAQRTSLGTALQAAEEQMRNEESAIGLRFTPLYGDVDNLEAMHKAAAQREMKAIQSRREQALQLLTAEEQHVLESAKRDVAPLDTEIAAKRKFLIGLQWEKARAAMRVSAYDQLTLKRYLWQVIAGA